MASTTGAGLEPVKQFEKRKVDHIRLSLANKNEAAGRNGLERIHLVHEALPDLDFSEVRLSIKSLKEKLPTPFLVSSMTAGHVDSVDLNTRLAQACEQRGWRMGVGSQRRELTDASVAKEWKILRKTAPEVSLLGNLGLSQLIQTKISDVERLVDSLEASGMIIHLNALQECLQPEGTPNFRGGLKAIAKLCKTLSVPVVVKETGCGFSKSTLKRLKETGVQAVDVSGFGGTHWGRIEGDRNQESSVKALASETLKDWGISTLDSTLNALSLKPNFEVWASGGVRSGLDAAKLLSLGAVMVGVAKPILAAALESEESLQKRMEIFEFEMKTAMFCSGFKSVEQFRQGRAWAWTKQ